ncbi:DUF6388 family protein [Pseudomonas sp. HR96]|uniref:DUF6388 family protein n=1 Tax=Pseudomonas sp. HR96 TaxID=1027966 RepID=UPI002A757940|nr:DUF6388 family protein [Pseudomonas sp. HR96]WPP01623.1 DUF6388 family protein [Pseudomonas sp. HR96]
MTQIALIPKEQRHQAALDTFLAGQPDLQAQIKDLSPREQAQQVEWEFEAHAEDAGLEVWELVLQTIARSPEELKAMRTEVHQEVAEALGMEWEEYRQLNEIED